eukprot:3533024-Prorocentrum_lima.AAC.1
MTRRLLQTYRALALFPEGVTHDKNWVVNPPCAELQDLARHVRNAKAGNTVVTISDEQIDVYNYQVGEMAGKLQRATQ